MTDAICIVEYVYNHLFCYLLQVNPPAPHSHLLSHDEDTTWTLYFQLLTLFAEFLLVFFFLNRKQYFLTKPKYRLYHLE